MRTFCRPTKLEDCERKGPDCELLIVEGDSAAKAVKSARDIRFQAVLPMQGKPLNAHKASAANIQRNALYQAVFQSLGLSARAAEAGSCNFGKVVMLFDPDADGIHCGALMTLFFQRALPWMIEKGMLSIVRAPLYEFQVGLHGSKSRTVYAYTDEEGSRIYRELTAEGFKFQRQRFRGLASLNAQVLKAECLDPETRNANRVTQEDALACARVFGGNPLQSREAK